MRLEIYGLNLKTDSFRVEIDGENLTLAGLGVQIYGVIFKIDGFRVKTNGKNLSRETSNFNPDDSI